MNILLDTHIFLWYITIDKNIKKYKLPDFKMLVSLCYLSVYISHKQKALNNKSPTEYFLENVWKFKKEDVVLINEKLAIENIKKTLVYKNILSWKQ